VIRTLDERPSIFIRDKPILSSEKMLHKDYDCKGSVKKRNFGHGPEEVWHQDEQIDSKPPVIK
jgi:hypothetical protein